MSFFTSRKPALFNFAVLLLFLASWLFSYMFPALKGMLQEDHLFYGTVTHASIPSIFGGSNIPFMDKTLFQINGDNQATFILYASQEMMDDMSEWFSFAAMDAGSIPLEISAGRIDEHRFVVHGISSTDGELNFDDLVMDYQVYYSFVGVCIVSAMAIASIFLFVLWFIKKRE